MLFKDFVMANRFSDGSFNNKKEDHLIRLKMLEMKQLIILIFVKMIHMLKYLY